MTFYDPLQRAFADAKLLGGFDEREDAPDRTIVVRGTVDDHRGILFNLQGRTTIRAGKGKGGHIKRPAEGRQKAAPRKGTAAEKRAHHEGATSRPLSLAATQEGGAEEGGSRGAANVYPYCGTDFR